jgi:phosphate transport system substrate-binding protein
VLAIVGAGIFVLAVAAAAVLVLIFRARGAASRPTADAGPTSTAAANAPPGDVVLRLAGSNTVGAELAPALVEAFFARRGASNVARRAGSDTRDLYIVATVPGAARPEVAAIRAEGTATAFDALASGTCDVGMASRAINDAEAARLSTAGLGDMRSVASEHVVALDGVAVVVHPDNKVRALDTAALRRVFSGEAHDWAAVGGRSGPIHVFARDEKSGTFDTFKALVLADKPLTDDATRVADSGALSDKVAADPAAVGFVGLAYVRSARAIAVSPPDGTPMIPSPFTVSTEDYVLSRRLYLYTGSPVKNALAQELVAFVLSPAGQAVVRAQGFVDLDVSQGERQACASRCPPAYVALTRNARRLSLDFRFRTGQDDLDSRATRDVDRLVTFLGNHRSGKVLLFGFSDGVGDAAANVRLSRERADAVSRELAARGVRAGAVEGFGSELPVGSNDDPRGREKNRRVEVWFVE